VEKYLASLIIPVYNVEKYLRKCLDSAINQTLKDIEIIIVNDGSTDNCPGIIQEYAAKDKRIKVINQENRGLSAARNVGIEMASADYIAFMDSDDWMDVNFMERMYSTAVKNDADIVVCNHALVFDRLSSDKFSSSKLSSGKLESSKLNSRNIYKKKTAAKLKYIPLLKNGLSKEQEEQDAKNTASNTHKYKVKMVQEKKIKLFSDIRHDKPEIIYDDTALRKIIKDSGIQSFAWGKFYKKSLFTKYNIYYPEGLYFEDMATTFKLFYYARKVAVIKDCLYYYLQRKNSISKKMEPKKVYDNITAITIMKDFLVEKGIFMDYYQEYRHLCSKMLLYSMFNLLLIMSKNKKNKVSLEKSISDTAKEIRSLMLPYSETLHG